MPRSDSVHENRWKEADLERNRAGLNSTQRLRDAAADGVDAEVIFPNKGLLAFGTPDPVFQGGMFRARNRWAQEAYAVDCEHLIPVPMIASGDLLGAMSEIMCAAKGF